MLKLIFKTQLYTIGIQVLNVLVLFIFLKYIDKSTYGEYVLYQGNLALFILVFSQNLYVYTRLKISGQETALQHSYLKTTIVFILTGIILGGGIYFFISFWFDLNNFLGLTNYLYQFLIVATLEVIITEFIRYFLATKEVTKRNNLQLIQRLSFFSFFSASIFLFDLKLSFEQVLIALFGAQIISITYAFSNVNIIQIMKAKLLIKEFWTKAYRSIIPFLPIAFSTTIMSYTDRLLINHFLNINSLAEYGIIIQIISMSNMLIGMSVILPVFPFAVEAFNKNDISLSENFFRKMMNIGLLIALIFSIFFVLNYDWFLELVGNGKYKQSNLLVLLMAFNTVFYVIITTLSHYFQLVKKLNIVIIISVISMLLNVGLNYTLIPAYGIVGSAFSSIITLLCMSISLTIYGIKINSTLFNSLFLQRNILVFISSICLLSLILHVLNHYANESILAICIKNLIGLTIISGIIFLFFKKETLIILTKIRK